MLAEIGELFSGWIAAVAAAVDALVDRFVRRRLVSLIEGDENVFTATMVSPTRGPACRTHPSSCQMAGCPVLRLGRIGRRHFAAAASKSFSSPTISCFGRWIFQSGRWTFLTA